MTDRMSEHSAEKDAAYDAKAWNASLPCPTCGNQTVIGYLLVDERGEHMHTRYVCTFWPTGARPGQPYEKTKRCGWEGWSVPGWDRVIPPATCPTCGPTKTERHPRRAGVIRCANCKEWLTRPIPPGSGDTNG